MAKTAVETAQLIQKFNAMTEQWTRTEQMQIRRTLISYLNTGKTKNTKVTLKLLKSLNGRTRKTGGEVDRIGFGLVRYGVFFHKGVGRGRGINKAGRKEKPFLNEPLDRDIPQLVNLIADSYSDRAINQAHALIK